MNIKELPLAQGSCCSDLPEPLADEQAEGRAAIFKALADPNRLKLLHMVARAGRNEACVCDLTDALDLSQPTVSHHLGILVRAGLLDRERRGTWAWYRINESGLKAAKAALEA